MRGFLRCCVIVLTIAGVSAFGLALPRFASRTGAKCQSCHVNPSGGWMRQTYGVQYGRDQLPVPEWSKEFEMEDFTNLLTNVLGVGADFRTLYYYNQVSGANTNAFLQMQGDVYLNFKVAKKVSMFIRKGLGTGYDIFGLLNILPASGHVKIGRFVPAFGTRLDDHTAFIRAQTGFVPDFGLTGIEAGVSPGPITVTGGFYNASDGSGNQKALLGRAEGMFKFAEETILGIGANVFTRRMPAGFITTLQGGLGSFSYKELTVFGEVDVVKNNGVIDRDGVVAYAEANYPIIQGLDLKVAYDFYDPDKDLKTGSVSRYSAGCEFFPIAGVEVRPIYRYVRDERININTKSNEIDLMVHFYL